MKRVVSLFLLLCTLLPLSGCGGSAGNENTDGVGITDVFGKTVRLPADAKVISCYASFAECWLLSGGQLAGVTEDAIEEHNLNVGDAERIGTVKHIDLEKVVSLAPDYVILSADLTAHLALKDSLDALGIPYGYFRVDVFADYKALMEQFCRISGREDLFQVNVLDVEAEIKEIRARIPETDSSVLLLRAFSTGMKAKRDDNLAGQILKEFGLINIADSSADLLEDLSLEHIVTQDPDYIFAMTMGDEEGARQYLAENAAGNPVWQALSAVKEGRYHMLPKELFHYKPNNRWSESYEYLAKLIWPEIFGQ